MMRQRKERLLNLQQANRKKTIDERRKLHEALTNDNLFVVEEEEDKEEEKEMPSSFQQKQFNQPTTSTSTKAKKDPEYQGMPQFVNSDEEIEKHDHMQIDQHVSQAKKRQPKKKKQNRVFYANQLQVHDYLLNQDLELLNDSCFMICKRPSGERCLVTSGQGNTTARNQQGYVKCTFKSFLPNGGLVDGELVRKQQHEMYNKRHCGALDCIFDESQKTFFVLDIIYWEDFVYADFPFCSRILFLQQKFANIPGLSGEQSMEQEYKFKLIEHSPCNLTSFIQCYYGHILTKYVSQEQSTDEKSGSNRISLAINKEALLKDLQDPQSQEQRLYRLLIEKISQFKWLDLQQHRLFNDLDYAIYLMTLCDVLNPFELQIENGTPLYIIKDGIIFTHLESLYERGLNTLVLHWRDSQTSLYCTKNMDQSGMIDATLRLDANYDFITLEEDVLRVSMFCRNREHLSHLQPGKLYSLKIKIDLDSASKVAQSSEVKHVVITEFQVQKKSAKVTVDHFSKIVAKFLHAQGIQLSMNEIATAIENNSEQCLSFSTKSMSIGASISAGSNCSKMSDIKV